MSTAHRLSARDVALLARAWRGGVSAGQLLLRCSPATADASAGPGTVAVSTSDGRTEVRAAVDGTPEIAGSRVSVTTTRTVPRHVDGDELDGSHSGSLRVGGNLTCAGSVRATGDLVVEQMVDRAELHAGRTLMVEARASNSDLAAGAGAAALQRIHRPAGDAAEGLALVADEYGQVAAVAAQTEKAASSTDLVRALVERRHPELGAHVEEVVGVLTEARRGWPELLAELADAFNAVDALLGYGRLPDDQDPLQVIERCAGVGRAAVSGKRPKKGDLRLDYAEQCTLRSAGSVRISGRGARGCTIDAGEDVYAVASGSALLSGSIRLGGVLRAGELGGSEENWLRIEFPEPQPSADLLRADVVNPCVEVSVAGQLLRFDKRQDNVRVGVEGGNVVRETR